MRIPYRWLPGHAEENIMLPVGVSLDKRQMDLRSSALEECL